VVGACYLGELKSVNGKSHSGALESKQSHGSPVNRTENPKLKVAIEKIEACTGKPVIPTGIPRMPTGMGVPDLQIAGRFNRGGAGG
jgi:hypothetical protein